MPAPPTPSASNVSTAAPALCVEDLSLRYGDRPALAGVTLTIRPGVVTAVLGPSGSGKSSFLMCLNRLIDMAPGAQASGRIVWGEFDVLHPRCNLVELRRRVGMIFQKPNPFALSISRNMELPLREHGVRETADAAARIEAALRDVGLWEEVKDRLQAPALSLSGGQQQRLCLARALVLQPDVLLLDEPVSALDPLAAEVIEDLITRLRGRLTLVVVTHNVAQARRIADDLAVFWVERGAGRLIESGPAAQVFAAPRSPLTEAFLRDS